MRVTTVFRKLLGVRRVSVKGVLFTMSGELLLEVGPGWRRPRCGRCGRLAPGYDRKPYRRWQHCGFGSTVVRLGYAPRRVQCGRCGVRTEQVPWGAGESRFTWAFEEVVGYLAQITDQTKVTKLTGISWPTVGGIVERVVGRRLDAQRLVGLRRIGVDEFSYRRRHRYLTVVVDHDRRRVVWAGEGRSGEVLAAFFTLLGEKGRRGIREVTIDMAGGYIEAVKRYLPQARIIFDRFHVQRLASDAVDEVRRSLVRELAGTEEARSIKRTRFVLLKSPRHLTGQEHERLSELQRTNRRLYRAYLLKEALASALDYRTPWIARAKLRAWMGWAARSRLKPFTRVARTIRKHLEGILAYVRTRLTNGVVEGLNTKLRMVTRRAFGFHSAQALISMLFLNCGGIQLNPPLPTRT
jgi:transposase